MFKLRMFSYVLLCFVITPMIITGCASNKEQHLQVQHQYPY